MTLTELPLKNLRERERASVELTVFRWALLDASKICHSLHYLPTEGIEGRAGDVYHIYYIAITSVLAVRKHLI